MNISQDELAHIRATRPAFALNRDRTGAIFYDALFERDPSLRALFPEDVSEQGRKLATTLAVVIDTAGEWPRLAPVLENLARRHVAYRVAPRHYAIVGGAFVETLRRVGASTEQIAAWVRVYDEVSAYMIERAYPNQQQQ